MGWKRQEERENCLNEEAAWDGEELRVKVELDGKTGQQRSRHTLGKFPVFVCIFKVVLVLIILASKDITWGKKHVNHQYFLMYTNIPFPLNFVTSSIYSHSMASISTSSC